MHIFKCRILSVCVLLYCIVGCNDEVQLVDLPGKYYASYYREERVLDLKKEGIYLFSRKAGGAEETYLGYWNAFKSANTIQVEMRGSEERVADPFDWTRNGSENAMIEQKLQSVFNVLNGTEKGQTRRTAFIEKSLLGEMEIIKDFDSWERYSKK
jgi:hypothetical protein